MNPEEELSVEVGDVDGVHVDDVQVLEAGEGEVLEELAAQAAGPHDEHLDEAPNQVPKPGAGIEGGVDEVAGAGEEHVQIPPPFGLRWRRRLRVRGSHLSRLPLEWTGEESVGVEGAAHKGEREESSARHASVFDYLCTANMRNIKPIVQKKGS